MNDVDDPWLWELRPRPERQAQQQAVDAAELHFQIFGPADDDLAALEVEDFVRRALAESAFDLPDPEIAVDLDQPEVLARILKPGASETLINHHLGLGGLVRDGVIHLHPNRIGKRVTLHEVAHYIAPRASHGPVWCRIYVDLVAVQLGSEAGTDLLVQLEENGAAVAGALA